MRSATPDRSRATIERVVREEWGYTLATLVGWVRDIDLAEDALQDAAVAALQSWPTTGLPRHPRAWLLQAARRKAIDRLRRDATFDAKRVEIERQIASADRNENEGTEQKIVDERLSLIFTCCHPALGEQVRVALTLRTLGGLTTTEIARAFLLPEPTLAQRLVRAKQKIKAAAIPYRVPPPDLCTEAIRLGRILADLAPSEPEVLGVLALMLLHESRSSTRTDAVGDLVTLEHQDRSRWDREAIREGDGLLHRAKAMKRLGPYQIQAAISAVHAGAKSYEDTDWRAIASLYRALFELQPSWVVRLNQAVAASYAEGPQAGLDMLEELDEIEKVRSYQPYHAARADFLRRAGRLEEAAREYRRAVELSTNQAERRFLERRLDQIAEGLT